MAALDLNALMDAVGVALAGITGLRVFDFQADAATPPAAIVGMPSEVAYDFTKGRGSDHVTIPVTVLVGRVVDRSARDDLSAYVAGAGSKSVKATLDGNLSGAVQTCRVSAARIEVVQLGAVDYLGATFDLEVVT
jgi:hypothetical protein